MATLNPASAVALDAGGLSAYQRSGQALTIWSRLAARTESPVYGFPLIPRHQRPIIGPGRPADLPVADVVPVVPPPPITPDAPVPGVRPTAPAATSAPAPAQAGLPWWLGLALLGAILFTARD